jgi:hypothetical protein
MQMQVDELILAHEDLGFILMAGGNRAMTESGAIPAAAQFSLQLVGLVSGLFPSAA